MKHKDVKKNFVDWSDGRLGESERVKIQNHLDACEECAEYYDRMMGLLRSAAPGLLPTLEPDPHLPTRLRAMGRDRPERSKAGRQPSLLPGWLRLSLGTAALTLGLAIGIYIGYGAGTTLTASRGIDVAQVGNGSTEIIDALYNAWSQSGFAEDWLQWDEGESEVQ